MNLQLTQEGREELALALLLWKDFKCQGCMDLEISIQMFRLSDMLGVRKELESLIPRLPPFRITSAL